MTHPTWWPAMALLAALPLSARADLVKQTCGSCHSADGSGELTRISGQRKTPEGWQMSIVRMRQQHGLRIDGDTQRELVRLLSASNGLAPSETEGLRYAFDRSPAAQEVAFDGTTTEMCGRCHTAARAALQRRTLEEWDLHIDFHIGQYPTLEYQALGRDRQWLKLAREQMVPQLAKQYPFDTAAWRDWQAADKADPRGQFRVATVLPGGEPVVGTLRVSGDSQPYALDGELIELDGSAHSLSGTVNVYTGYEWRATVQVDGQRLRQVLALSEDGARLSGRQFLRKTPELGGTLQGVRSGSGETLGAWPAQLAAGANATVQLVGDVTGPVAVEGLAVSGQENTPWGVALQVSAPDQSGRASVAGQPLVVYAGVDRLSVEPAYAVARVGDEDGPVHWAPAAFDAIGWLDGADGQPGTEDDIRIGALPATWRAEPFDELAEELEDVAHAGELDERGRFWPGAAGPNPERPFSTNNAGNLKIVAEAAGLSAEAQLIVTVQRWVDPPLR